MLAELACFEQKCHATFPLTEAIYNCTHCGGLLEVRFVEARIDQEALGKLWRERIGCWIRAESGAIANCCPSTDLINAPYR
jgi:hypothetical protein